MTGNIKLAGFEIRKIDHKEMMIGLALIALSFLMPVLFTVQNFQVREYMHLALEKQEKTDLMVAALRLVMLNALRAAPHYIGAYYIAESVELYRRGKKSWIPNACMILLILPLVYEGIGLVGHWPGARYSLRLWFACSAFGFIRGTVSASGLSIYIINKKEPDAADFYYSFSVPGHHATDERSARGTR